ncbi:hypothetical protein AB0D10_33895 [Kitasatospora sp. NPDC048545]|uniref:hypothetical protein n=1 Tax=Kitasatospora sp. NPDC048545 TaxID=3157208 RepID=UPI0033C304B8
MSTWWDRRRSARLAELAYALEFFGAEPVEDPGVGELAHAAEALAKEYRASDRGHAIHRTGELLQQAAAALHTADRLRGTPVPVVNHHLRCAALLLACARACLQGRPAPGAGPGPGAHDGRVPPPSTARHDGNTASHTSGRPARNLPY